MTFWDIPELRTQASGRPPRPPRKAPPGIFFPGSGMPSAPVSIPVYTPMAKPVDLVPILIDLASAKRRVTENLSPQTVVLARTIASIATDVAKNRAWLDPKFALVLSKAKELEEAAQRGEEGLTARERLGRAQSTGVGVEHVDFQSGGAPVRCLHVGVVQRVAPR